MTASVITTVELAFPTEHLPRGHTLLQALADVAAGTGQCLRYLIHEDREQPGRFMLYEAWQSAEALSAYLGSSAFLALADDVVALASEPVRIRHFQAPRDALARSPLSIERSSLLGWIGMTNDPLSARPR